VGFENVAKWRFILTFLVNNWLKILLFKGLDGYFSILQLSVFLTKLETRAI
jgi:hypothetical protein